MDSELTEYTVIEWNDAKQNGIKLTQTEWNRVELCRVNRVKSTHHTKLCKEQPEKQL